MAKFDIELLLIFEEIYKTGSTTRAAENLNLAQPTVSIGLNKLRIHFGDGLFCRTSKGMLPTPFAQAMISEISVVTSAMQKMMERKVVFKAAESTRTFKVSMPDISEVIMLPTLLNYIAQAAPSIRIDVSKITSPTPRLLETGELDLTIGFLPPLSSGIYQQTLFEQNFVCIVATNHPRIGTAMTRQAFIDEKHVLVKSSRAGHSIVEKTLAENHLPRKVLLTIPSYLSAASIIANTDCIATVPARFGVVMEKKEAVRIVPPPIKFPNFAVKQHWHERYHSDPGNIWLRQVIAQLFTDSQVPSLKNAQ